MDLNHRSPQGAAGLQPAAFDRSATCPQKGPAGPVADATASPPPFGRAHPALQRRKSSNDSIVPIRGVDAQLRPETFPYGNVFHGAGWRPGYTGYSQAACGRGETGRRTSLRSWRGRPHGSSSLPVRTTSLLLGAHPLRPRRLKRCSSRSLRGSRSRRRRRAAARTAHAVVRLDEPPGVSRDSRDRCGGRRANQMPRRNPGRPTRHPPRRHEVRTHAVGRATTEKSVDKVLESIVCR